MNQAVYPRGYKQNALFTGGPDVTLNACVGKNGGPYTTYDYAVGYFTAAGTLADQLRERRSRIDLLIYPVAYLYRHGIELGVKSLCEFLPTLWNENGKVIYTHELLGNWAGIKPYLMQNKDFDTDGILISTVETILRDLVEIDPKGEVFRFAQDRGGGLHLQDTRLINLNVLAETMEYVRDALYHWHRVGREIGIRASKPSKQSKFTALLKLNVVSTVIGMAEKLSSSERSAETASKHLPSEIFATKYEPARSRLKDYLNSLSAQERVELSALMWLGRGDADEQIEDWDSLITLAYETGDDIDYIVDKEPLATYLRQGLAKFKAAGIDLA